MAKKKLSQMTAAERAKRIAELVKNPGTRASIPTQYLPAQYRQKRELNARLAQPVVPGSSMTNLDLARASKSAAQEKYGAAEGQARQEIGAQQQRQADVGSWFDQYLAQVNQYRQDTAAAQQAAQAQIANLGNVQGQPAPKDAQNQDVANKAAAIRSALLGSMQGQLLGTGQAANTYANLLANVVAPGQKVQALTTQSGNVEKARQALADLLGQKGAFVTDYKNQTRQDEGKNVLAQQALGLNAQKAKTQASQAQQRIDISSATQRSTAHDRAVRRQQSADKAAAAAHAPNKYGVPADQWARWSSSHRQRVIAEYDKKQKKPGDQATQDAKDFYNKYGVKPADQSAVARAKNSITTASSYVNELKKAGWTRQQIGQALLQGINADKAKNQKGYPKQPPLWLTVALDLAWLNGRISGGTANKLHHSGYSVKVLGLSTGGPTVTGPKDLPASKK